MKIDNNTYIKEVIKVLQDCDLATFNEWQRQKNTKSADIITVEKLKEDNIVLSLYILPLVRSILCTDSENREDQINAMKDRFITLKS